MIRANPNTLPHSIEQQIARRVAVALDEYFSSSPKHIVIAKAKLDRTLDALAQHPTAILERSSSDRNTLLIKAFISAGARSGSLSREQRHEALTSIVKRMVTICDDAVITRQITNPQRNEMLAAVNIGGFSVITNAVSNGDEAMLKWLCSKIELHSLAQYRRLLIQKDGHSDRTLLHYAAEQGNVEIFNYILSEIVAHQPGTLRDMLKWHSRKGASILSDACHSGNVDMAETACEAVKKYAPELYKPLMLDSKYRDTLFNPLYFAIISGNAATFDYVWQETERLYPDFLRREPGRQFALLEAGVKSGDPAMLDKMIGIVKTLGNERYRELLAAHSKVGLSNLFHYASALEPTLALPLTERLKALFAEAFGATAPALIEQLQQTPNAKGISAMPRALASYHVNRLDSNPDAPPTPAAPRWSDRPGIPAPNGHTGSNAREPSDGRTPGP